MGTIKDETYSISDEMIERVAKRAKQKWEMPTKGLYPLNADRFPDEVTDMGQGRDYRDSILSAEDRKLYQEFNTGGQKDTKGKLRYDLIPPEAMQALAEVYSLGAKKYEDRNWEKGIPFNIALGALKRHLNEFELGNMINSNDGTLAHLAHVMWWSVALVTFIRRNRDDLNNLPAYNKE